MIRIIIEKKSIEYNNKTYWIDKIHPNKSTGDMYYADGYESENSDTPIVLIKWKTTDEWNKAVDDWYKNSTGLRSTSDLTPFLSNESNACDWENPDSVEII